MALIGIGQVSQELADLIMRISRTTENQAASASSVAQSIQRILLVNSQTNEGTQQTAGSILQLSDWHGNSRIQWPRFRVGVKVFRGCERISGWSGCAIQSVEEGDGWNTATISI